MVKIENIVLNGNEISIDCLEEGDQERMQHVVFDVDTWEILNDVVANMYVKQGIARVGTLFEENHNLPNEAYSYWY